MAQSLGWALGEVGSRVYVYLIAGKAPQRLSGLCRRVGTLPEAPWVGLSTVTATCTELACICPRPRVGCLKRQGSLSCVCKVRFMLETMLALKNNDMRKIPGYDPEPAERLRKLQRTLVNLLHL